MRVRLVAARVTAPPSRRRQSSRSRDDRDGRDGAGPCRAVQAASDSDSAPDGAAPVTRTLRPAARRHRRAAPARAMIRCLMRRIRSRSGPARSSGCRRLGVGARSAGAGSVGAPGHCDCHGDCTLNGCQWRPSCYSEARAGPGGWDSHGPGPPAKVAPPGRAGPGPCHATVSRAYDGHHSQESQTH